MFEKYFELNEQTLSFVEVPGSHVPDSFFIHSRRFPVPDGFEMTTETAEPDFLRQEKRVAA